jgi:hypothetical protein
MNKLLLASLLSVLAWTASAQQPAADTVRIPASAEGIVLPEHPYHMSEGDFYDYIGVYELSNGQTLHLYSRGYAMFAEVDKQGRHRIVAVSENAFVAMDRQLKVRIDLHSDGTVGGEMTMVVPSSASVAGAGAQLLVAAFR